MRARAAPEGLTLDGWVILYTTWPDAETAQACASEAVAARLAACANILAPMHSIYRWEGAVEQAVEIPMLLKTTRAASIALRDLVMAAHPYDAPCVVSLSIEPEGSTESFLSWIDAQVINPQTQ